MKHKVGFNRLGRKPAHRKALHRNMVTSLLKHERIRTTKAKAREIRRTAEKMITRAKVDSVHNRRMIARDIKDKAILAKLFVEIGPRFKSRPGGYTRMLKIGQRAGDAADMVILELVEEEVETTKASKKATRSTKSTPKSGDRAPAPVTEKANETKEPAPSAESDETSATVESPDHPSPDDEEKESE
jgi:large subunit ribosomal protein L17